MTPEILDRCKSCGVTIRERAMFCPECGKPLQSGDEPLVAEAATVAMDESPATPAGVPSEIISDTSAAPPARGKGGRASEMVRHGGEKTRETWHKASSVARGAIEDNVKRVEKIHHVSSVMFEEAHYDASLRFVLVALGLFIVFVILLVLSKVMG